MNELTICMRPSFDFPGGQRQRHDPKAPGARGNAHVLAGSSSSSLEAGAAVGSEAAASC